MLLIVGLGNGESYHQTRHNIGAMIAQHIIDSNSNYKEIKKSIFKGELYKDRELFILKPLTYMNNSGVSVLAVKKYFNIDRVVVIQDDLDINFGSIKFKNNGGNGGHNGIKSISNHIGESFIRVKFGIGKPTDSTSIEKYVLSKFNSSEEEELQSLIYHSAKAILELKDTTMDSVSNRYTIKT